jgi:hypothetical protein
VVVPVNDHDPELMRTHDAWLSGDLSALDAQDIRTLAYLIDNGFRTYEMAYFSREYGLYGPDEWSRMELLAGQNDRRGQGLRFGNWFRPQ